MATPTANGVGNGPVPQRVGRDLIQIVNTLEDKLAAAGQSLNLQSVPQIVAVGCQGAGKSSVLENIVGKEFLPRGQGVVTRRPTIVQLHPHREGVEYAIFLHKPNERITDFKRIKEEIIAKTLCDVGPVGYSSQPITVKFFSPNVLKLTLVDLPGLVQNGAQSESVVQEVKEMVLSYIRQPKCIILAVCSAKEDIATSDSLRIANGVDPQRERTIGVVTQLDLMKPGTDATDCLENKIIHLKRGYVGVVNRSQLDIENEGDIESILAKETRFFQEHYRPLASRMGTKYLQTILRKQLRAHIQSSFPPVIKELDEKYADASMELDELNKKLGEAGKNKSKLVISLVDRFDEALKLQLYGQSEDVDMQSFAGGAQINFLMCTKIPKLLGLNLEPDVNKIAYALANVSACRTSVTLPSLAFDAVCRDLLRKFKRPLEESVAIVTRVLINTVKECTDQMKDYPFLRNILIHKVNQHIKLQEKNTKDILTMHIEAEMNYMNFYHPDFQLSASGANPPENGPIKLWSKCTSPNEISSTGNEQASTSTNEGVSTNVIGNEGRPTSEFLLKMVVQQATTYYKITYFYIMISKYIEVVRKIIKDLAAKYIMFYLVQKVKIFTEAELLGCLLKSGTMDTLLIECEDDIQRQKQLEATLDLITGALEAINEF